MECQLLLPTLFHGSHPKGNASLSAFPMPSASLSRNRQEKNQSFGESKRVKASTLGTTGKIRIRGKPLGLLLKKSLVVRIQEGKQEDRLGIYGRESFHSYFLWQQEWSPCVRCQVLDEFVVSPSDWLGQVQRRDSKGLRTPSSQLLKLKLRYKDHCCEYFHRNKI